MKYIIKKILIIFSIISFSINSVNSQMNENFECHVIEKGSLNYPEIAETADFDGDGLLDIYVGTSRATGAINESNGSSHVAWFKNLGDGTYKKFPIHAPNARSSYVYDFDNDGDQDILIGRTSGVRRSDHNTQIELFENDGEGNFSQIILRNRRYERLFDLRIADFNNDGLMDFYTVIDETEYVYDSDGQILYFDERGYILELYINKGSNNFSSFYIGGKDHVDTDIIFAETAFGDFDGDQDIDIAVRDWDTAFEEYDAYVYLFNGTDRFEEIKLPESRLENMNSIQVSDIDDDGDLDISTLTDVDGAYWYNNDGSANFTQVYENISRLEFEADIDGDGDLDRYNKRNSWQENVGNNEFLPNKNFIEGNYSISLLDVDEDGDLDILASQYHFSASDSHTVDIYLNDGAQNYNKVEPSLDENLYWAETIKDVDLDQDGAIDVLGISKTEGKLFWYRNDGSQNFSKTIISESIPNIVDVTSSDFDLDGDIDLVSISTDNEGIIWWENNGNQNFTKNSIQGTSESQFIDVRIIDINKDNYPDFIVQELDDEVIYLFTNDLQGSFTKSELISNVKANSIELIDINNNGFEDLIVADQNGDQLLLYLNNEGINFIPQELGEISGLIDDIKIVDFDEDGQYDLITASNQAFTNQSLDLWLNIGQENFIVFNISSVGGFGSVTCLDYDNDGDLDVISSDFNVQENALNAWINNGDFTFSKETLDQTFFNGRALKSTDLDGDGDLDILAASNGSGIKWYENDGTGGGTNNEDEDFSCYQIEMGSMNGASCALLTDIDGDGLNDIYVSTSSSAEVESISSNGGTSHVAWFKNLGEGNYEKRAVRAPFVSDSKIEDIDNDGDPDIIYVSNIGLQEDRRTAYYFLSNMGDGTFEEYKFYEEVGSSSKEIFVLDLNNDGLLDIYTLIDDFDLGVKMMAFYNDGQNLFSEMIIDVENHNERNQIECATNHGDISGDGFEDIVIRYYNTMSEEDLVYFYENDGDNGFREYVVSVDEHRAIDAIEIYDADEDGDLDFGSFGSTQRIWISYEGGGTFTSVEATVLAPGNFDWDGDGDLDRMSKTGFLWQENINNEYYETQFLLSSLESFSYTSFMDVDEDGDLDIIHSFPGRLYEPNFVKILYNNGNQNFTEDYLLDSYHYWPEELKAVDLDFDGDLDLLVTQLTEESLYWLENDGNQNFSASSITDRSIRTKDIVYADFDLDGDLDFLTLQEQASRGGRLWTNNGSMSFSSTFLSFDGEIGESKNVELLDFNKDGYPDLIMSDIELDKVVLLINDQQGGFIRDRNIEILIEPRSIAVQDMYDNGFEDLIIADARDNELLFYRNNEGADFTVTTIGTTTGLVDNIKVEDIDNDGDYDIITSSFPRDENDPGQLLLWINDGTNNFITSPLSADGSFDAITCGDYDADGDIDIISAAYDVINNGLTLWKNDGNLSFTAEPFDKNFFNGRALQSVDLDGNGTLDLIGASNGMGIKWWSNENGIIPSTLVFDCPEDVTVESASLNTIVNYDNPNLTSDCPDGAEVQVIAGPASGALFDIGITQVVFEATDNCGTEAVRCTVNFEVILNAPITLTCIPDVIAYTEGDFTNVSWATPTFETECYDQNVVIQQIEGPISGSEFPIGTTTISYSATTACNSETTCSFNILVEQEPTLTVTCADDIFLTTQGTTAVATWDDPTYETTCPDDMLINIFQVEGPNSGSNFPIGTTVITYEISNECDNIQSCSFNVIVQDENNTLSVFCPDDIQLQSGGGAVQVFWDDISYESSCPDQYVLILQTGDEPGNGGYFEVGTSTITYEVQDGCDNTSTCSFDIIIDAVDIDCPDEFNGFQYIGNFEGDKYFISNGIETWEDANQIAQANGGHLVSINSVEENNFIYNNINEIAFIGYNDSEVEGTFEWSNGDPLSFGNLSAFNSNNSDYGYINFWNGSWNLAVSFEERKFLMEIDCDTYSSCGISANINKVECDDDNLFFNMTVTGQGDVSEWKTTIYGEAYSGDYNAPTQLGPFSTFETQFGLRFNISDAVAPCNSTVTVDVPDCPAIVACPEEVAGYSYLGEFKGQKYFISDILTTWAKANEMAQANDGNLVSINDAEENSFLENLIHEYVFIGLSDTNTEGIEEWANGDDLDFTNYADGASCFFCAPNSEERDFAHMNFWNGRWSFDGQWVERRHILEYDCGGYGGGITNGDGFGPVIVPRLAKEIIKTEVEIFPNPVIDELFLNIKSSEKTREDILIYDARGALLYQKVFDLKEGSNQIILDVKDYPEAMYFIKLTNLQDSKRFIKKN